MLSLSTWVKYYYFMIHTHRTQYNYQPQRMGYVIIRTTNVSRRVGIKSRCRRFDFVAVLAQSVLDLTAVIAVQVVAVR